MIGVVGFVIAFTKQQQQQQRPLTLIDANVLFSSPTPTFASSGSKVDELALPTSKENNDFLLLISFAAAAAAIVSSLEEPFYISTRATATATAPRSGNSKPISPYKSVVGETSDGGSELQHLVLNYLLLLSFKPRGKLIQKMECKFFSTHPRFHPKFCSTEEALSFIMIVFFFVLSYLACPKVGCVIDLKSWYNVFIKRISSVEKFLPIPEKKFRRKDQATTLSLRERKGDSSLFNAAVIRCLPVALMSGKDTREKNGLHLHFET